MTNDDAQVWSSTASEQPRLRLSSYHVVSEETSYRGAPVRVLFSTRTGQALQIAGEVWQALVDGAITALPDPVVAELRSCELLVDGEEDELSVVLARSNREIATSGLFKLVVQPTAACQLGCDYCGQEHTAARLCPEHQDAIVERARTSLETGEYHTLSAGWFGSEPLLGIDVIRSMTPRLRALAEEFGCEYHSSVVSNGLRLDIAMARELAELGVSVVEVTVDGLPQHHDRQRPYKSGRSSFGTIMRNVVAVAQSDADLAISLRCNVTAQSAPDVPAFIELLAELGLQEHLYRVYFAPIHSWGNDAADLSLERSMYAAQEIGWMYQLQRGGFRIEGLPKPKPVVCMATSRSAELIDAHGEVFNCTEVSYVPTYGTPNRYSLGNVAIGTKPERRNLLGDFNRRVAAAEVPCTSCRLLPVCGGSCPKAWLEGDQPCPGYKWSLPTRLLMELPGARANAAVERGVDIDEVLSRYDAEAAPMVSTPVEISLATRA